MGNGATSGGALINLIIYCAVVGALAGLTIWLARWRKRSEGSAQPHADTTGTPPPAAPTWERTVRPRHRPNSRANTQPSSDEQQSSLFTLLERHEYRALWAVFGVALLLRLLFLGTLPNNLTADEVDFAGDALAILHGGGPPFFGLDWTQQPALSVYLISWSWRLFGVTIFAERLVSALLTAAAIFPFYALVRRAVSVPAAFAATLLLASSWWFLHFSRSAWTNGHVILYLLLAAWTLTRALERQRWRDWIGFGAALALLLYGYFSGRTVVVACLAYLALVLWWRWRGTPAADWRRPLVGALVAGGICTLLFFPMLIVALRDWQDFTARTGAVFIFNHPRQPGQSLIELLLSQVWTTIRAFVLMDPVLGTGRYKGPGMGWIDPLSAALYVVGLVLAVRRGRAVALWWCLLLFPLGMTQVLTEGIPDGARGLVAVAPMYFFAALSIDALLASRWLRGAHMQIAIVGVILFAMAFNVRSYVVWMAMPQSLGERQPAISAAEFPRWRDFQEQRLAAGARLVNTAQYNTLPPNVIDAWLAGETPDLASAILREIPAQQTATIGAAGAGPGQLATPRSVAVDDEGYLYVADAGRGKIVRYAPDGSFLAEWGDPAQLGSPTAIVATPDDTIIALDGESGRLVRYDRQGTFLGLIATLDGRTRGMAVGLDGQIYLARTSVNQLTVLPGTGPIPPFEELPPAEGPSHDQPTAASANASGMIFVYEPIGGRLRAYGKDGQLRFTQQAPGGNTADAGGMALLPDGRLLIANPDTRRIMVYSADGAPLGSFVVEGVPQGIGVTPDGLIAVIDIEGKCVRLYDLGDS